MKRLGINLASWAATSAVASGAFLVSLSLRAAVAYSCKMVATNLAISLEIRVKRPLPSSKRLVNSAALVGSGSSKKARSKRFGDDLLAQFFKRAAAGVVCIATHQHVGSGHFGEVGDVFL